MDIVSIARIRKIIGNINLLETESVFNSVFTKKEIEYCLSSKDPDKHYAVRFAGKEAFLKALGTGLKGNLLLSDIEFLNEENGKPHVNCYGGVKKELLKHKFRKINVSFSHSRENAVAIIILEK
jgi:holo-[acyl-carrier protein] synthase